jgi:hypothetical protein
MITVTASNLDDLAEQLDALFRKDDAQQVGGICPACGRDRFCDAPGPCPGLHGDDGVHRECPSVMPRTKSVSRMMFVGNLDDFDGNAYRVSEDGKAYFRVYDPDEPHGEIKIEVNKPLRQRLKDLGLAPTGQRIRVTIEVLP